MYNRVSGSTMDVVTLTTASAGGVATLPQLVAAPDVVTRAIIRLTQYNIGNETTQLDLISSEGGRRGHSCDPDP
jgi:hypothetical protein